MSGRFDMQPKSAESPFVANVKFEGLDANRVVTEAGGRRDAGAEDRKRGHRDRPGAGFLQARHHHFYRHACFLP